MSQRSQIAVSPGAWIALGVFVLALLVRVVGMDWGLKNDLRNQSLHPDEGVIYAYSQLIEPARLQFDPGFYNYGTLYLTVVKVAATMTATYTGAPDPKNSDSVWAFVSRVHTAGRIVSALAGAGTALFVFLIARRVTNVLGAFAAGAAIAFAPGHVVHSRFQTVDVLAFFFLAASAYFALRLLPSDVLDEPEAAPKQQWTWIVLSGLFAGLSAGTKYTGILALLTLFAALWLAKRPRWVAESAAGAAVALVAFLLATPGIFLHTAEFVRDFQYEMTHTSTGHGLIFTGTAPGFIYHVANLGAGMGFVMLLVGLAGVVLAAIARKPWMLALLAFFLPYYLLIGRAEVKFLRYTFPLYATLAVGLGWLVGEGHRKKGAHAAWVAAGILGIGGVDFGGARAAATMTNWMANPDPRDEAARWLKENGAGKVVGLVSDPWFYTVPIYRNTGQTRLVEGTTNIRIASPSVRRTSISEAADPAATMALFLGEEPFAWDVRLLDQRPDFVVFSSFESNDVFRLQGVPNLPPDAQVQVDRARAFRERLEKEYTLAKLYGAGSPPIHDLEYVRPTIYVWQRK